MVQNESSFYQKSKLLRDLSGDESVTWEVAKTNASMFNLFYKNRSFGEETSLENVKIKRFRGNANVIDGEYEVANSASSFYQTVVSDPEGRSYLIYYGETIGYNVVPLRLDGNPINARSFNVSIDGPPMTGFMTAVYDAANIQIILFYSAQELDRDGHAEI